jgi:hypothetical protein
VVQHVQSHQPPVPGVVICAMKPFWCDDAVRTRICHAMPKSQDPRAQAHCAAHATKQRGDAVTGVQAVRMTLWCCRRCVHSPVRYVAGPAGELIAANCERGPAAGASMIQQLDLPWTVVVLAV